MAQQRKQLATVADIPCDGLALKPTATELRSLTDRSLDVDRLVIDFEGHEHVPERAVLDALAEHHQVFVTTPVRADGFDPLGDHSIVEELPSHIGRVLVAGHPAYLNGTEAKRAIAPRLREAVAADNLAHQPWIGTESVERIAMAIGGVQYELLSKSTGRTVRALRNAGYDAPIAVYAPTVLSDNDDVVLDALGDYVARRKPVREALSALDRSYHTDSNATGEARSVLRTATNQYGIAGDRNTVAERIESLRASGVTDVICHPAAVTLA
ncbi:DUF7388 family protein [Halocatena halophila]|uniref:DUF7388 family protein n=1 Tax=Halocatena halophila TaxID=2814576 RepID=UPI002ED28BC5